ncbi:MAG: hypothetical protein AAF266_10190 [Planctomycetota bacterium]
MSWYEVSPRNVAGIFIVVALCLPQTAICERLWTAGVAETFVDSDGRSMAYRYYLPDDYRPDASYPLILSLHGAGQVGTDNVLNVSIVVNGLIAATASDYPAILLAPQVATPGWTPNNPDDLTTDLLDEFLTRFPIDRRRLYITGASMGGFGTMRYLEHYHVDEPGTLRFAAAAPTAGAFISEEAIDVLRTTPIWLSHNTGDPLVSFESSLSTYNALTNQPIDTPFQANIRGGGAGGPLAESGLTRLTAGQRDNHNSWGPLYQDPAFYDWLFDQSLPVPEPSAGLLALIAAVSLAARRY